MNPRKALFTLSALVFAACALPSISQLHAGEIAQAGPSTAAPSADAAEGKKIYAAMGCYQCHGYAGQGGEGTGPALVSLRLSDEAFVAYVRKPARVMPAFSPKILPQDSLLRVLAYIRTLDPGRPPAQIPLLAPYVTNMPAMARGTAKGQDAKTAGRPAAEGKQLFEAHCAVCHGADLHGVVGPDLRSEATKRSVDQTVQLLLAPPPGMPKLSPQPLSAAQMSLIAAYVRGPH
jgi:ubiquinol-cytochrome c reductase cytochrome c subunit